MTSFSDLKLVNTKVNLLPYKAEVEDNWVPITEDGDDCDGYATAKQWRLVHAYGWPETALRLACCFIEPSAAPEKKDRYHLVLLADIDGTTYVLDNRHPFPMEFDMLPYEWHKFWSYDLNAWEWAKDADRSFG